MEKNEEKEKDDVSSEESVMDDSYNFCGSAAHAKANSQQRRAASGSGAGKQRTIRRSAAGARK